MSRRALSRPRHSETAPAAHPALTRAATPAAAPREQRRDGREGEARPARGRSGEALAASARSFFEPRFGADLGHVRVHSGPAAARAASAFEARAFTVGANIYFGRDQYRPGSPSGRRLLAHELTHVFQQGSEQTLRRKGGTPGGFLANIGGAFESLFTGSEAYDPKVLEDYLKEIETSDAIVDDFDSDNKARAVVAGKLHVPKSDRVKRLLVEEMLSGVVGDDDENAILQVLGDMSQGGRDLASTQTEFLGRLYSAFDGAELDALYAVLPIMDSLHPRRGDKTSSRAMQAYIDKWSKENNVVMTDDEKYILAQGCIGITSLEIGKLDVPDLSNCYESLPEALAAKGKMDAYVTANEPGHKVILFSKRFWRDKAPAKDKEGKVDLANYDYDARREGDNMVNYDYGLFDEKSGMWWHANHCDQKALADPNCDGPMYAFESTLEHYSRPLKDFNRQVFCVAVAVRR
ncbi:MAG TPA: DUF4157 domain-containing protein [Allosphingosinicella sp.]|nr:DUF4157 domain-containing protein [Allosphingosinicella sp.]